jgi:hypothetical protein
MNHNFGTTFAKLNNINNCLLTLAVCYWRSIVFKGGKKMRSSKTLASIVGVCLIPISGLIFMQKANARTFPVGSWPTKASPGKCTTLINISSSGRDTWYWDVECGRNNTRKSYQKAKAACNKDYDQRKERYPSTFDPPTIVHGLIPLEIAPYAHNQCH